MQTEQVAFVWLGSFEESLTPVEGGDSGIESPFAISFGVQILCMLLFPIAGKLADRVGLEPVPSSLDLALDHGSAPSCHK